MRIAYYEHDVKSENASEARYFNIGKMWFPRSQDEQNFEMYAFIEYYKSLAKIVVEGLRGAPDPLVRVRLIRLLHFVCIPSNKIVV